MDDPYLAEQFTHTTNAELGLAAGKVAELKHQLSREQGSSPATCSGTSQLWLVVGCIRHCTIACVGRSKCVRLLSG
jgi:hypothetical protein